jgi:predicted nucleic acid-binding protein
MTRCPASYVLDTDVAVAGLRSDRGASRQLLLAALNRQFEWLLSVRLILEYEAVMTRPQHLAACGLSSAEVRFPAHEDFEPLLGCRLIIP